VKGYVEKWALPITFFLSRKNFFQSHREMVPMSVTSVQKRLEIPI
jgi:hypothetical protein